MGDETSDSYAKFFQQCQREEIRFYSENSGRIALNSASREEREELEKIEEISSESLKSLGNFCPGQVERKERISEAKFSATDGDARSIKCFCLRRRVQGTVGNKAVINARG
ncbi:hypothetical protein K0M31_018632, partial [Melipona bicolor]